MLHPSNPAPHATQHHQYAGDLATALTASLLDMQPPQGDLTTNDHQELQTTAKAWNDYEEELAATIAASADLEPHPKRNHSTDHPTAYT